MQPARQKTSQVLPVASWCAPKPNTTTNHYNITDVSSLAQKLRQLTITMCSISTFPKVCPKVTSFVASLDADQCRSPSFLIRCQAQRGDVSWLITVCSF